MPLGVTLLRACPFKMSQREGEPLAILPGTAALLLTCGVSCHCPTLANMGHARVWGRAVASSVFGPSRTRRSQDRDVSAAGRCPAVAHG